MKPAESRVLTINGGSSSIKFALFEAGGALGRILGGELERIGTPQASLIVKGTNPRGQFFAAGGGSESHRGGRCSDGVDRRTQRARRIGRGGASRGAWWPDLQRAAASHGGNGRGTPPAQLLRSGPSAARDRVDRGVLPASPQIASGGVFRHRLSPHHAAGRHPPADPRRYEAQGVRRYGFHGLSYEFLMAELARLGDPAATKGRAILAHLGNGASLAAVRDGKSIDTSMSFTPTAGLVMSTRSGDLDPGLVSFFARTEQMNAAKFQKMVNHESGMLGVSETSSDMRDCSTAKPKTYGRRKRSRCSATRPRNGSARSPRRWADGHAGVRRRYRRERATRPGADLRRSRFSRHRTRQRKQCEECAADPSDAGRVKVRVIRTDEELMIARSVTRVLDLGRTGKP